MDGDGVCRGVMALNLADGTVHRFAAHMVVLATGGCGRVYFSSTSFVYMSKSVILDNANNIHISFVKCFFL